MASQQHVNPSNAGSSSMCEEFTVRIPRDKRKVFTMMKFGTASNVDFAKMGEQPVKMERENNLREYKTANDIDLLPKFGAGSEYGRELKEESRRKKYGIMLKKYNPEDQPWILKLGAGKQGKRFKGVREGTIADNTSYYIFTKAGDGAFEAFPVGEWYNFTPVVKYKYLNSEEAEEEFIRRDKTLNFFNIMLKKRLRKEDDKYSDDDDDEDGNKKKGKKKKKKSKNMILTDMEEWNDLDLSDDDDDDDDDDESKDFSKKKNAKGKKKQKVTKNSKKNSDDEAIEESDEGDYDDREVDYISDSGSSDSLSGPELEDNDKNKEKGVDEEKGLRNILDSDAEDDEDEVKEEVEEDIEEKEDKKEEKSKKGGDDSSSSSSDDDSDIEKNMSSAIFLQKDRNVKSEKKDNAENETTDVGEASTSTVADKKDRDKGLKRKIEKSPNGKSLPSKKHKSDDSEGITEDAIRRYLTRKPMTTKDLLQKFRSKKLNMTNEKIAHTIAQLLKKLNPEKTTINKKLYLSLKKPE